MKKPISIFNEVLGPIMRGPSSSHTAGAYRIGLIARKLFNRPISKVIVVFSTKGSLPTTYKSQGSEIGLITGLMGSTLESDNIQDIVSIAAQAGLKVETIVTDEACSHPNTYNLTLFSKDTESDTAETNPISQPSMKVVGISTGGGMVEIINVDGIETDIEGDTYEEFGNKVNPKKYHLDPILPIHFTENSSVPFHNALEFEELLAKEKANSLKNYTTKEIWEYALEYEASRGNMSKDEVWTVAKKVLSIMRQSLNTGLNGTKYKDRILGQQFDLIDKASEKGKLIDSPLINRVEKYALAIMECKSSFGLIVAAPTAGSCAVIPAAILACYDEFNISENKHSDDEAIKALLAAGLIGVFIAEDSTFSAEVAGCQAECGAASGMAAAALVQLKHGTTQTALHAASFALQNILGMICDPIANRVEAPCLGKNIMCAMNAISSANIALAKINTLIPLSQVIQTMDKVGKAIIPELRCTSLGGLSVCPASKEIEKKLNLS
ncbi:MAG: L-serine ammonia-lyase, iron-sulfur-dependent, subunit alpha [Bacteroidales bacterium]